MAKTLKTTWKMIDDRVKVLKKLYDRMDESRDFVYMDKFKLRDFKDTHNLDNVVNVTGNSPAVFANAIVSDLISAKWQCVVEGDISPKQAHNIESFIEDNFAQADEMLLEYYAIPSLYSWLCSHVCIRSLIGVRWLSMVEDGQYKVDCLPVDMRWTPFVLNRWVAPIFWRNTDDLEAEFGEYSEIAKAGMGEYSPMELASGNEIEVRDYWTKDTNELWVKQKKVFTQKNTLGKLPFVIVSPAAGFMLRDKSYLEHDAEDLFFLNRQLYDELNRSLSIEQTLGMDVLFPPMEQEQEDYGSHVADKVPKSGEVLPVRKGELHKPVPRGDLNKASLTARADIQRQVELGGISDAELGAASLDRPGIWFAKQFEIRHKLERARYEALAIMKEGLARLMVEQFIKSSEGKHELMVGRRGRKNGYAVSILGDPDKYRISFKFMASSKEMEIVNLAEAQAARGIAPMRIIIRDILQAEDPDGWQRELDLEKAKEANPALSLAEMAVRYAEEAEGMEDETEADLKKWQSMILVHDYKMLMRQRMQPKPVEQASQKITPEQPKANLQGIVALPTLLGQGGMGGKAKEKSAQEVIAQ